MKQRIGIAVLIVVVIAVLALLSSATYVQKQKVPDAESYPNRSTFNAGSTGTQAFFTLAQESGRNVVRWQQPPAALLTVRPKDRPRVLVVVGSTRREIGKDEATALLDWVSGGGQLILIDRAPDPRLLATSSLWKLVAENDDGYDIFSVDASDQSQMTAGTAAIKPVQPSLLTFGVNTVQTSRFAGQLSLQRMPRASDSDELNSGPTIQKLDLPGGEDSVPAPADRAPAVILSSAEKGILVEAPYGEGKIIALSDPYVVSNGGIGLADNARLSLNLLSVNDGVVAFDEYHQGYGADSASFLQFFAGTPVVALFCQGLLLLGFVFYSRSRRFGRPIPESEPDRLSKLEYVGAIADLQRRTKAYDIALENIYSEFRRRMARKHGLDASMANSKNLAAAIASAGGHAAAIERTLFQCEEIIRGEPTNKREVLRLTAELRELETQRKIGSRAAAK